MTVLATPAGVPRFGPFRVLGKVGAGGMADVYRVVDERAGDGRVLVLKRIRGDYTHDESFSRMLAAEARITSLLHHPAIAELSEYGEVGREPYLLMELVDGCDLRRVLRLRAEVAQPLAPALACRIVGEVAAALAYAHQLTDPSGRPLEIVHRDVSPSNIMIARSGAVKLVDFGVAKAAAHIQDERTRTGVLKGKLSYMSPEQSEGLPLDRRSDIFALGIVFHECLTLERVLRGENELETLRLIRQADVLPPSHFVPRLPRELDEIVMRMLARAPADRYPNCDEVVAALDRLPAELRADAAALGPLGELVDVLESADSVSGDHLAGSHDGDGIGEVSTILAPAVGQSGERTLPPSETKAAGGSAWRSWLAAAVVAALVSGVITQRDQLRHWRASAPPVSEAPATVPPARPASPPAALTPPPAPAHIHLAVQGQAGADLLLDGQPVGVLPLELDLARIKGVHRLTVTKAGYYRWTQEVSGASDQSIWVTLQKKPAPGTPETPYGGLLKDPFATP
jgi:serine/threonine-protein kinase